MLTVIFTPRQVALTLRILMQGQSVDRLAKNTRTAADDLRRIAAGRITATAGVLSHLGLRRCGANFAWDVETARPRGGK